MYRYDGCMCVVGIFIPDDLYDPKMEGNLVTTLFYKYRNVFEKFSIGDIELLAKLQFFHDNSFYNDISTEKNILEKIAFKYDIHDTSILDKIPLN